MFIPAPLPPGAVIDLPADTAVHVAKVLRARRGDALVLFNGDGCEAASVIEAVRGSRVSVAIGDSQFVDRESPLSITLLQCVSRADRMDMIVQKATELGVARIVPILSQRSVVRLDGKQAEAKCQHWRAVATSACEQCGRNRLPVIDSPRRLRDHLGAAHAGGMRLLLDPGAAAVVEGERGITAVEIAVGPEGGFADEELDAFRVAGFRRVRLGPRILRTETAAIAALVWLQTRIGDLRPPDPGIMGP